MCVVRGRILGNGEVGEEIGIGIGIGIGTGRRTWKMDEEGEKYRGKML